jgi:hypothetical protein
MKSLREARDEGNLEEFVAEREKCAPADAERFEAVLTSMARKSKSAPETLPPDCAED